MNMDHSARSHVEPIGPDLLHVFVKQVRLGGHLQTTITVALIYDAIITMDREIKYFWKLRRRPVDFVYFANRYIGIFGADARLWGFTLSENLEECDFAIWTPGIANWLVVIMVDYILTIRVLALYSRGTSNTRVTNKLTYFFQDRTLRVCLYLFLALEAVTKLAIIAYVTVSDHATIVGTEGLTICGEDNVSPWRLGIVDWSAQLAYGVILMALALYKAAEYWRVSVGFKGFTLVKVLIEDQVVYFMACILVSVFTMLEFRLAGTNTVAVLSILGNQGFLCILGSRMLLNLKEAGSRGQNEGTSFTTPSRTVSDIEFGEPPANAEASQAEEANDSVVLND